MIERVRAAVLAGPGRVELVTVPRAEPRPTEVRVAFAGSGVCGSNLPVWEGRPWFRYPLAPGAPGHEAWGHVDAVGDDVVGLPVGTPVAVLVDHAFAESGVVAADRVVALPGGVGDGPFPGEALGCGFNVAARSDFGPGQTVAVVGVGFLGAVIVALAARAGARVIAISRRPFALEVAREMGAAEALAVDDRQRVIGTVGEITGGRLCDTVVEAVGAQEPLDLAGHLTRERGRLVIAGFHQDGPRTVDLQLWNWRGIDIVNAHERDPQVSLAGIRAAVDAASAGWLEPARLCTHAFSLDRLGDAMDAMVERPDGFLKAVVTT